MKEFKLKVKQYYSDTTEVEVTAKFPESVKWFSNLEGKYSNYITVVDSNEDWIEEVEDTLFRCYTYKLKDKTILIFYEVNIDNDLPIMNEDEFYSLIDLSDYTILNIDVRNGSISHISRIVDLTSNIGEEAKYNCIDISDLNGNECLGLSYLNTSDDLIELIEGNQLIESRTKKIIRGDLGDKVWSDALNLVTSKFTGDRFISSFNWRLDENDKGDINKIINLLKQFENED